MIGASRRTDSEIFSHLEVTELKHKPKRQQNIFIMEVHCYYRYISGNKYGRDLKLGKGVLVEEPCHQYLFQVSKTLSSCVKVAVHEHYLGSHSSG